MITLNITNKNGWCSDKDMRLIVKNVTSKNQYNISGYLIHSDNVIVYREKFTIIYYIPLNVTVTNILTNTTEIIRLHLALNIYKHNSVTHSIEFLCMWNISACQQMTLTGPTGTQEDIQWLAADWHNDVVKLITDSATPICISKLYSIIAEKYSTRLKV